MCNICMSKLPLHIRNNDMTFDPSRHHHCDSATFVDASRSLVRLLFVSDRLRLYFFLFFFFSLIGLFAYSYQVP